MKYPGCWQISGQRCFAAPSPAAMLSSATRMQLLLLPAAVVALNMAPAGLPQRSATRVCTQSFAGRAFSEGPLIMSADPNVSEPAAAAAPSPPSAYIEFIKGVPEPVVPDVKLTRSRDGSTGVATFTFDNPSFLSSASSELGETTGMYLNDDEGELRTSEVTATFVNGKPRIVKGVVVMRGPGEWDRFMRFMERYAESNGLGFSKA